VCDVKGCNAPPEYYPVLVLRTPQGTARAVVGLKICMACRPAAKRQGILAAKALSDLHASLKADPARTTIDWCGLKSKEGREFAARAARN